MSTSAALRQTRSRTARQTDGPADKVQVKADRAMSKLAAPRVKTAHLKAVTDENVGAVLGAKDVNKDIKDTKLPLDPSKKRAALGNVSNVTKSTHVNRPAKVKESIAKRPKIEGVPEKKPLVRAKPLADAQPVPAATRVRRVRKVSKVSATSSNIVDTGSSSSTTTTTVDQVVTTESVQVQEAPAPRKEAPVLAKKPAFDEENVQDALAEEAYEHGQRQARAELNQEWEDLDADDHADPLMVSEYVGHIFDYMKELEHSTISCGEYIGTTSEAIQKEITWRMRGILIDWLVEVHNKFRLLPETLYLCVNIIDRFLAKRPVSLVKLQLVGITAMFIASKYEEVVAPTIQNFLYMADGGYSDDEILRAERYILQVLDFGLHYPSPMTYLRRVSKADLYDIQTRTLAKYLMEVSLVDERFLGHLPSQIAAAGMYLARRMLSKSPRWSPNLVHYSGYTEREVLPVVMYMVDYLKGDTPHEALFKKYASKKFMKAAIFVRDWMAKLMFRDVVADARAAEVAFKKKLLAETAEQYKENRDPHDCDEATTADEACQEDHDDEDGETNGFLVTAEEELAAEDIASAYDEVEQYEGDEEEEL